MNEKLEKILKVLIEAEKIKIIQIDRLFYFLEEITEITDQFLMWLVDYCKRNDIPLYKEERFKSYVTMSSKILKDIEEASINIEGLIKSRKLPLNKFHRRSPEDLPEPVL